MDRYFDCYQTLKEIVKLYDEENFFMINQQLTNLGNLFVSFCCKKKAFGKDKTKETSNVQGLSIKQNLIISLKVKKIALKQ